MRVWEPSLCIGLNAAATRPQSRCRRPTESAGSMFCKTSSTFVTSRRFTGSLESSTLARSKIGSGQRIGEHIQFKPGDSTSITIKRKDLLWTLQFICYAPCLEHWQGTESETLKIWRTSSMEAIRVTETARNRIDAIFTGSEMFFFNPDFGLVAIANRHDTADNVWDKKFIHYWKIERSEQIGKDMIGKTIKKYYSQYNSCYLKVSHQFEYTSGDTKPQHALPYIVDITYKN